MRKIIFVFLLINTQFFAMQNPNVAQPDSVQIDIAQGEQQLPRWQAEKREMQSQFAKTKRDLNCWVWTCTASTAVTGLTSLVFLAAYLGCKYPRP